MPRRRAAAIAGYEETGKLPAGWWTALVAAVLLLPAVLDSFIELMRKPQERDWLAHFKLTGMAAVRPLALVLRVLTTLPYDALICLDAIWRSAVRMLFTHRGLLLWHTRRFARRN